MVDIDAFMGKFCEVGARAIKRYVEISGESPDELPEYFMPAFIFNEIGIAATLETRISKLLEWNDSIRGRRHLTPRTPEDATALLKVTEDLGRPRVDMVLYQGDKEGQPKYQLEFLALVEFKRDYETNQDRPKLIRILSYIDTCAFGIVCGCISGEYYLDIHRTKAKNLNDRWFQNGPVYDKYFFCANLFKSPRTP